MKKVLIAASALVAIPAFAQNSPPMPMPPMAGMPGKMMMDRVQTRAEVIARTQKMFAMLDTNHDGVLDQAELAAAGKRSDGAKGGAGTVEMARMPLDRNAMFDMIDTNHDGSISRDEFARAPMPHGGGMGGNRDVDRQPDRGHGMGMGGGMARMWAMADTNHDGRVTLKEATDLALQHFDRMDANHDGQLTPEERAAGRGMRAK